MMKINFFALFFLLTSVFCMGQDTPQENHKLVWGLNTGFLSSRSLPGEGIFLLGTVQKNRHEWSLGPVFGSIPEYSGLGFSIYKIPFKGGSFFYRFYPSPNSKRVNLYFIFNLSLFHRFAEDIIREPVYPYTSANYKEYTYRRSSTVIDNTFGYGMDINFLKRFYFTHSLSVGISRRWRRYSFDHKADQRFFDRGMGPQFRLGIGYRFGKQ